MFSSERSQIVFYVHVDFPQLWKLTTGKGMTCLAYPLSKRSSFRRSFAFSYSESTLRVSRMLLPLSPYFTRISNIYEETCHSSVIILRSSTCYNNATFTSKKWYRIFFACAPENRESEFPITISSILQPSRNAFLDWFANNFTKFLNVCFHKFEGIILLMIHQSLVNWNFSHFFFFRKT